MPAQVLPVTMLVVCALWFVAAMALRKYGHAAALILGALFLFAVLVSR